MIPMAPSLEDQCYLCSIYVLFVHLSAFLLQVDGPLGVDSTVLQMQRPITIQYIFGIETRPGTSQRADSPLMGSV
jgi:hypothetical protein